MDFETVWSRIVEHEGETFYTVRDKKPFTYEVSDNYIIVSRAKNTRNTKNNIKKAFENIDVLTKNITLNRFN
jgi:hypothetical protein